MFKNDKLKGFMIGALSTGILMISSGVFAEAANKVMDAIYSQVKIVVNGQPATLFDSVAGENVTPINSGGKNFLPIRAMSELLNIPIEWDPVTKTISLQVTPQGEAGGTSASSDSPQFKTFYESLASAIAKDDAAAVSGMVEFPLVVQAEASSFKINTKEAFVTNYKEIISDTIKAAIASSSIDQLTTTEDGITTTNGEIWFRSSSATSPQFRIFAIDQDAGAQVPGTDTKSETASVDPTADASQLPGTEGTETVDPNGTAGGAGDAPPSSGGASPGIGTEVQEVTPTSPIGGAAGETNPYEAAGISSKEDFDKFYASMKEAFTKGKEADIEKLISFPSVLIKGDKEAPLEDAAAFKKQFAKIFTKDFMSKIAAYDVSSVKVEGDSITTEGEELLIGMDGAGEIKILGIDIS